MLTKLIKIGASIVKYVKASVAYFKYGAKILNESGEVLTAMASAAETGKIDRSKLTAIMVEAKDVFELIKAFKEETAGAASGNA